ncbi:SusC/RagA family TonB-linked outer membrane protein [Mucilaginibacter gracilis]|nr:SusC/RagA family TonB-linked outer membrane protein [Mucilaginibacter gracilis]
MRLTTIILIATFMQVSAATFAQRITLNQHKAPIESVLKEIRHQSGFDFYYDGDVIPKDQKIDVAVTNVTVEEALTVAFKGLLLNYKIDGKTVVITKKTPSFLDKMVNAFATIDVHGRVVDEKGQPLQGVTIKLKEGSQVTTTDKEGNFTLQKVDEKSVIVISFIGYLTKEMNVSSDLGIIALEISNSKLDEVRIQAYTTTTRRFSTSNSAGITKEQIEMQPINNPILALQARIPGILITQESGNAGSGVDVLIQGKNSLRSGLNPFYVIDGVPFPSSTLSSFIAGSIIPNSSPLSYINPSDIESIEVLKDADATAIYGSRAANGAILITTKKGKAGETKTDVNLQSGWSRVPKELKLLNTQDYLAIRKEAFKNDNIDLTAPPYNLDLFKKLLYPDLAYWDQNKNTDWQKELIGGTAHFTNLQANISGGSQNTQFLIGGGYTNQTTVYNGDFADKKASFRYTLNHTSSNKRFRINLSGTYLQDDNILAISDLTRTAMTLAPNAPDLYLSDGTLNWEPVPNSPGNYSFRNPLFALENKYSSKTSNLLSNMQLGYELIKHLTFQSNLGFNKIDGTEYTYTPMTAFNPGETYNYRSAKSGSLTTKSWIIEPQFHYQNKIFDNDLDVLIGSTFQQTDNNLFSIEGSGFNSDSQLENIQAAPTIVVRNNIISKYHYNALFSRLNYAVQNKYIMTLAARRDGSSRFGEENIFANFYSAAGAWLFSEENFVKSHIPVLSFGKMRLSYGTTGNDQIGDYSFSSVYDNNIVDVPYQGSTTITPRGHSNPYLQWEVTKKLNFGLDLGFLNNKILINANYYVNRSSNQLIGYPLTSVTGFGDVLLNIPATIKNSGLEVQLDLQPLNKGDFKWNANFNLTIPRNKLVAYKDLDQSTNAEIYVIGQSIDIQRAYAYRGVNPETGLYQYLDKNGKITSEALSNADQTVLINTDPKFYGGLTNSIRFKHLQLDFTFQYVKRMGRSDDISGFPPLGAFSNNLVSALNRWTKPGDNALIQKSSTNSNPSNDNFGFSEATYSDASFIRIKNASLSYEINPQWTKSVGFSSCRIYLHGQNLLTWTKYKGLDPETLSSFSLPPLRTFTLGIQFTL